MTSSAARIWVLTTCFVIGTALGLEGTGAAWMIPAAACGVVAALQPAGRAMQLIGLGVLVAAGGWFNASARAEDVAVARLAAGVPRCQMEGTVAEHAGGLGTILEVTSVRCGTQRVGPPLGEVVLDGRQGEPGGPFSGTARLVPLGSSGFATGRRRAGADAGLADAHISFGAPRGIALAAAGRIRRSLQEVTSRLSQRSGSLLLGLAIGDTSGFSERDEEHFRRSGLSHLTAVSGSNVAIVVGAVVLAAGNLGHRRRILLAGAALGLFVLVVGPEPSVLRAAAMGAIALLALVWGWRTQPLNALGFAVCAVIAFRPAMVHSVGLQLSVLATAGLVIWSGSLARRLRWLPRPIAMVAAATMAAQFAVAPLLAGVFGAVSLSGPAANVAAAAAVAPATVLSLMAAVIGCFSVPLGALVARCAEPFATWILWVSDLFGAPGWASIEVGRVFTWTAAVLTVVAAGWSFRSTGAPAE